MDPARTLRTAFLLLAATHVIGLHLAASVTAWTGSAALTVLLLASLLPAPVGVARGWPRQASRVALASLTVVALLLDFRTGGLGWPALLELDAGSGVWGPVEAALLAVAGGVVAVAALGAVGLPRRWRHRLLPGLGALAATAPVLVHVRPSYGTAREVVVAYEVAATAPLHVALALLGLSAGALALARRWATAAGLAVVAVLLLPVLSGVMADDRLVVSEPARESASGALLSPVRSGRVSLTSEYVDGVLFDRVFVDGMLVSESSRLPWSTYDDFSIRYSLPWRAGVAERPPRILPPPEPPLVPGDPSPTAVEFWTVESVWRTPVWVCMALLLAVTAVSATIAEPGTRHRGLPDHGRAG
jgi:hypothetical protein